jgi:hypothetical protein
VRRSGEVLPTERAIRRCHKCQNNYKPDRAHHDSMTGRCIVKFDHFCPWIKLAVGALNHKHFCLFLLYTATSCLVSLLLIVGCWIQCGGRGGGSGAREGALDTDSTSTSDGSAIDMHNYNPNGQHSGRLLLPLLFPFHQRALFGGNISTCLHFGESRIPKRKIVESRQKKTSSESLPLPTYTTFLAHPMAFTLVQAN